MPLSQQMDGETEAWRSSIACSGSQVSKCHSWDSSLDSANPRIHATFYYTRWLFDFSGKLLCSSHKENFSDMISTCPWIFPHHQGHSSSLKPRTHTEKPSFWLLCFSVMSSIKSLSVTDSLSIQVAVTDSFWNCSSILNLIIKDYFNSDVPVCFNTNRPQIALEGLWHIPDKIRKEKKGASWGLIIFASLYYHIYCIPTWNRGAVKAEAAGALLITS